MTDLITEAREQYEQAKDVCETVDMRAQMQMFGISHDEYLELSLLVEQFPELCDALEKANAQIESIHKSLDFAETQRQKSKNYTELAINNGLALGRIAVTIQHDFGPLPAAPEEGAEHE